MPSNNLGFSYEIGEQESSVSDDVKSTKPQELPDSSVKFHYIKSNYFRVIHVDGGFGGLTPKGDIFLSLYNERAPLPDVTVQSIEEGRLGEEIVAQRKSSDGIVRELEVGVSMSIETATAIRNWLDQRLTWLEKMQESQPEGNEVKG